MENSLSSQLEALRNPALGAMLSSRNRARGILNMVGFCAFSSVAGCAISEQGLDWQEYRDRADSMVSDTVTPDADSGVPDTGVPNRDSSDTGNGEVGPTDSGPAPCLPAGDIVVSADNVVNLSDMRSGVGVEIPFRGNCDALGGTSLSFELNDGLTSRQNRPVLQVDNAAHMVRARLDLSTLPAEANNVSVLTELAGSRTSGRFNIDFIAPTISGLSTYVFSGSNYSWRATFSERVRVMMDILRSTDGISYLTHGDTSTACTTLTESSDCSMPSPDGTGRTQACGMDTTRPVANRRCEIREGRVSDYPTAGVSTLFTMHMTDYMRVQSSLSSSGMTSVRLRIGAIDVAGNSLVEERVVSQ